IISVVNRSFPCLSCHFRVRNLPSTNTCEPLRRYSAAISPNRPNRAMLCHSVRSCCAPEALSFHDSLVAILMFVTVIPLGMERVSGSAPRLPTKMTLFTPRAMSYPRKQLMVSIVHAATHPNTRLNPRTYADMHRNRPAPIRQYPAVGGVLPALDAAGIVVGYMQNIRIRGARTHNLQNIDLDLPRDRLIVLTGLSGSGKSSLAFDTIYAEGQRRYVESLSTYARQFLSMMEKPDIDTIEGLSPAISIEQKSTSHNPRSTVGTVSEIYDSLRLLYARAGTPRCPDHHIDLAAQTVSQMVDAVLLHPEGTALMLLAPAIAERKGEHAELIEELQAGGFVRALIDGEVVELDHAPKLDVRRKHTVEAIIDRFKVRPDLSQRLAEWFETALRLGQGVARIAYMDDPQRAELVLSDKFACPICNYSLSELEPRLFSFNSPIGACPACDGLGTQDFFDPEKIVANPHLSLAGGAVRGWDRRNAYYFQLIQSLARHTKFDIEAPFASLPQKIKDLVLFGSDDQQIEFKYLDGKGGTVSRRHTFEGIVRNLERRYKETESATVREELAKYRSSRPCPECHGTRLNRAARNVFVAGQSVPELSSLSVEHALQFFGNLKLLGWRGEIAVKIA